MVLEVAREATRLQRTVRRAVDSSTQRPETIVRAIGALTVAVAIPALLLESVISQAVFLPVFVLAGLVLSGRQLVRALAIVLIGYVGVVVATWGTTPTNWSVVAASMAVLVIVVVATRRRHTMGVPLALGTGMLKDLRLRLDRQATPPEMPVGTCLEHCVLPARGDAFSGDFVVAARRDDHLLVALTDVSGHGPYAGMRALLLSGALSGLLGETRPEDYLPAANRYLIRQGWRDGFASAIHVSLEATTGAYCIGTAGHPSAAHYHAGDRRWEMITGAAGLLLGLFEQGPDDYARAGGTLEPGDVLLLYTDGVVEGSDGDLAAGTQHMLALAQEEIGRGLEGSAQRICEASARAGGQDDRSVVVIWRSVPESAEARSMRD